MVKTLGWKLMGDLINKVVKLSKDSMDKPLE